MSSKGSKVGDFGYVMRFVLGEGLVQRAGHRGHRAPAAPDPAVDVLLPFELRLGAVQGELELGVRLLQHVHLDENYLCLTAASTSISASISAHHSYPPPTLPLSLTNIHLHLHLHLCIYHCLPFASTSTSASTSA